MSKLTILSFCVCCGYLSIYFAKASASDPFSFPYAKALILSLLIYVPLQLTWSFSLYPNYFSPFLVLPQAPRSKGWKDFFRPKDPPEILEIYDNTPNDGFIHRFDIFGAEVVELTEPKLIIEVTQTKAEDFMRLPRLTRALKHFLGDGLIAAEGAVHKHQRKNLTPAFNFRVIKNLYPLFWTTASQMVSIIKDDIHNSPIVNISDLVSRASLDIIGQAGFGADFASLTNPHTPLVTNYQQAFIPKSNMLLVIVLMMMLPVRVMRHVPLEYNRKVQGAISYVTKFLEELIQERKREMFMNLDDPDYLEKNGRKDIISTAMTSNAFSNDDLVNQSKTFLAAGHDTTASAVAFGIHALSLPQHAHIQTRLREEICANLPSPESGIEVDADMLDKLPYLDAVCKEVLRVYPPAGNWGRVAKRDTEIDGVKIPKGTTVRATIYALNQAKHLWGEDARVFNPERWLSGENKATGGATDGIAFMTFGYGPRVCIGRKFAEAEHKALLAALVGSFNFKPTASQNQNVDIEYGITTHIRGGLRVIVTPLEGW